VRTYRQDVIIQRIVKASLQLHKSIDANKSSKRFHFCHHIVFVALGEASFDDDLEGGYLASPLVSHSEDLAEGAFAEDLEEDKVVELDQWRWLCDGWGGGGLGRWAVGQLEADLAAMATTRRRRLASSVEHGETETGERDDGDEMISRGTSADTCRPSTTIGTRMRRLTSGW
jgi:hypothetical protein